jgi:hypothetical protein
MPPNEVRKPRPSQETRPAAGPTTNTQFTPNRLETPAAQWRSNASEVILALARGGVAFHVDDLLMLAGDPPRTQQLGAIFATASSNHKIEVVGATLAEGRLVRVWRGCKT